MKLHTQLVVVGLVALLGLSFFFPLFNSNTINAVAVVDTVDNSFPSTFYITFQKQEARVQPDGSVPESILTVRFLNGTSCDTEQASFTFSLEENQGTYTVKFMLSFDGFSEEISLPATVSNGQVYIDDTPTIFVVNPDDLTDGNTLQILQTESYTLSGTVQRDSWAVSLIDNYELIAKWVQCYYQPTGSSNAPFGTHHFLFDPTTGILLCPPDNRLEDVLLTKLGISAISYGMFVLSDYSENLHQYFTLSDVPYPYHEHSDSFSWELILISVFVVVFVLVVFFAYRASLKNKNRGKRKTYSNMPLKFNYMSRIVVGCFYG
ncbi:MAG: hypothetical protein LBE76_01160 [Nitrososphaerota archaeon]|jgi:cbb3-type cytochrome oxidase subunit 3|nr:hypothetical protein [Nitrososphaerota archaeon]